MKYISNNIGLPTFLLISTALYALPVGAVDLNYESLSSLEQPLAFDYNDITFNLTGLTDAAFNYNDDDSDSLLLGNFQLTAETQLANSWTLGAAYFGEYSDSDDNEYVDNAALFLGGIWGTGSVGNVTGLVREQTRRIRGVGNATLSLDDQLGQLSDVGFAYTGRFGPTRLLATLDDEDGFELGGVYQRPIGNKDYRLSFRYRDAQFTPDNELAIFDSQSIGLVAELTYGSTVYDVGVGFEELSLADISVNQLGFADMKADRQYLSFGAARKIGAFTFSGEAHAGDIDGQNERSYALGMKYDIARGMSLNFGINHSDAEINLGGISILSDDETQGTVSFRYSF